MVVLAKHRDKVYPISCHYDHIGGLILRDGFYEHESLSYLENAIGSISAGRTILDIGANVGNHSVFFSSVLGGKVLAFEPFGLNFARLEQNALRYGFSAFQMLVGDGGRYSFDGGIERDGGDMLHYGMITYESDVDGEQSWRLDDVCDKLGNVLLIKIDVDGMEVEVIRGALELIRKHKPLIWFECYDTIKLGVIKGLLTDCGLSVGIFRAMEGLDSEYMAYDGQVYCFEQISAEIT